MRATKYYYVRTRVEQRRKGSAHYSLSLLARKHTLLNQFHKTATNVFNHLNCRRIAIAKIQVVATFERSCRGKDSDNAGACFQRGRFDGRFHPNEGH